MKNITIFHLEISIFSALMNNKDKMNMLLEVTKGLNGSIRPCFPMNIIEMKSKVLPTYNCHPV